MPRLKRLIVLALLLAAVGGTGSAYAQDNLPQQFFVSQASTDNFPQVEVTFRALTAANQPAAALTRDSLQIYENGQPVTVDSVSAVNDAPATLVFIIDRGRYENRVLHDAIRNLMLYVINGGYFQDGIDSITVLSQMGSQTPTTVVSTSAAAEFTAAVATLNLDISDQKAMAAPALETALQQLQARNAVQAGPTAIFYITRTIENTDDAGLNALAQRAGAAGVPIYAVQAATNPESDARGTQRLRALATMSGGEYLLLRRSDDNTLSFTGAYSQVLSNTSRLSYVAAYRSTSGVSGTRTVQVIAPFTDPAAAPPAAQITYDVNVQPPAVRITSPMEGGSIDREAKLDEASSTWRFGVYSVPVTAEVTWSDGTPRQIREARLLVGGAVMQTITPAGSQLAFDWDIKDITENGDNPRTLTIQVTDELGLSAEQMVSVRVPVNIAEGDLKIEEITVVQTVCEKDPTGTECILDRTAFYAPYVLLAITLLLMLRYRRQLRQGVGRVSEVAVSAVTNIGGQIRETMLGINKGGGGPRSQLLATLKVLDGPTDQIGQTFEIYNRHTVIGRDDTADIQLYRAGESSSVSRRHCELKYQEAIKGFVLADLNSKGGTTVSGRFASPNQNMILKDGDEIILGDLGQRGARLRFANTMADGGSSDGGNETQFQMETTYQVSDLSTDRQDVVSVEDGARSNNGRPRARKRADRSSLDDDWQSSL